MIGIRCLDFAFFSIICTALILGTLKIHTECSHTHRLATLYFKFTLHRCQNYGKIATGTKMVIYFLFDN